MSERELKRAREELTRHHRAVDAPDVFRTLVNRIVKMINYLNSNEETRFQETHLSEHNELRIHLPNGGFAYINLETLSNSVYLNYGYGYDYDRNDKSKIKDPLTVYELEKTYEEFVKIFKLLVKEQIIKELVLKRFNDVIG